MTPARGPLASALEYRLRGWYPIPVPLRSKNPGREGWQNERLDEAEIRGRFAEPCNVSVLLGEPSGGLTDIDLDSEETRLLAHIFLPPSRAIFGRPGNPGSHVLYRVSGDLDTRRFQDPVKRDPDDDVRNVLVEIRSTGAHTLFPGSVHPSGEEIAWVHDETPPNTDPGELSTAVGRLAAAALLARHWPDQGSRQDTAMALAGTLLRAGWVESNARDFICAVAFAAHDEEHTKRGDTVAATAQQLRSKNKVTGTPSLRTHIEPRVVDRGLEWLGIGTHDEGAEEGGGGKKSQADELVEIGSTCDLFTDSFTNPMAAMTVGGHREVWPLRSRNFASWLRREFWLKAGKAAGSDALNASIGVLEGMARFDGEQRHLHNRIAQGDGVLCYDLASGDWSVVVITHEGWQSESSPPILFRRYAHQKTQCIPSTRGDPWRLFDFLNVREADRLLLLVWLIAAFIPNIPHPILHFYGQKGAAKSTGQRVLRRLIDPSSAETLSLPTDKAELIQQLSHHYAPVYDNLDSLPGVVSDIFCRAVTGDAFTKRELYSDDDDFIYSFIRVLLLNGINIAAQRPDLLDRTILIQLERVARAARRTEREFWQDFDAAKPLILGGVFDALAKVLNTVDSLHLPESERMADFTRYGAAITLALGRDPQDFLASYRDNLDRQSREALDASLVGRVLMDFMDDKDIWSGTPTELLHDLETHGCDVGLLHRFGTNRVAEKGWPGAAHILSRRIAEIHSNLLENGIEVVSGRENERTMELRRRGTRNSVGSVGSDSAPDFADAIDATDATFGALQGDLWRAKL